LAMRDHDRGNRGCMNEFWIATFFIFKDRSITKLVTETLKNNVKVWGLTPANTSLNWKF
jgi:hypothetical protein